MPVIKFLHRSPSAMPYMPFPVEVAGLSGVIAISAGSAHSLAVMKDGTVRAWGENRWGEVRDGTTSVRHAPVVVPGVKDAVGVAAGSGFSAAVLRDGTVMTWGNQVAGGLGRAAIDQNRAVPALVPGVKGVRRIVAGHNHVLALTEGGTIVSWAICTPDVPATSGLQPSSQGLAGVQSIAAHGATSVAVLASRTDHDMGFPPPALDAAAGGRVVQTASAAGRCCCGWDGSSSPGQGTLGDRLRGSLRWLGIPGPISRLGATRRALKRFVNFPGAQ